MGIFSFLKRNKKKNAEKDTAINTEETVEQLSRRNGKA